MNISNISNIGFDPGEGFMELGWSEVKMLSRKPEELKGISLLYAVLDCLKDDYVFDYTKPLAPKDKSGLIASVAGNITFIPVEFVQGDPNTNPLLEAIVLKVPFFAVEPKNTKFRAFVSPNDKSKKEAIGDTPLEAIARLFVKCIKDPVVLIPISLLDTESLEEDDERELPLLRDYYIGWEIELSADSVENAAKLSRDYMLGMASVFDVADCETGVITRVDLWAGTQETLPEDEPLLKEPVAVGIGQTVLNEVHRLKNLNPTASLHSLIKASLECAAEHYEITPAIEQEWDSLKR